MDGTYDVLQEHRRKNRPSKVHLRNGNQTNNRTRTPSIANSRTQSPSNTEQSDEVNQPSGQRARRHSKKPLQGPSEDPTQLQFYPDRVQQVLSAAKMNWRLWLVMEWAFPKYRERKNELSDCLTRAIAAYETDGGVLDDGTYLPLFLLLELTVFF